MALVALIMAVAGSACGGRSRSTTSGGATDPNAQLLRELCRRIQSVGCSPYATAARCEEVFQSELESAKLEGCEGEEVAFDQCFSKAGFVCMRGVLFSNGGCDTEIDALMACSGTG